MITYEDFQKVELRVGRIVEAADVAGSEKLLKLVVDIGPEKRQLVAGIKKQYKPDDLIGREIIVVANLAPRSVMGVESNGMLLAADDNGPVILKPDRDVPPGARIK